MNKEKILKELNELYFKYRNCEHLQYPQNTPAPHHCMEGLEKIIMRTIKHHQDMLNGKGSSYFREI